MEILHSRFDKEIIMQFPTSIPSFNTQTILLEVERVQLHARTHARILKFKKPSPLIRSRDNFRYVIFSKRSSIWPLRIATCIQISDNGSYYREYKEFKYEIWSPRSIITSNNSRSIQFEWLPSEVMFEKKKRREKKIGRGLSWNRR